MKFMPGGDVDLDTVELHLWRSGSSIGCISNKPPTELTTCIEWDRTYELRVNYYGDKPKKNKYNLVIEEVESFDIDMYREPEGTKDQSNAVLIELNKNIVNDVRSSYDYYKIQFSQNTNASLT